MTFNEILERMLNAVPDKFDKREGSVIYDALAPAALELEKAYEEMNILHDDTYARTASRSGLILRAEEFGIAPFSATYAIRKAVFEPSDLEVELGERFNLDAVNYSVSEKLSPGVYALQCETIGSIGNYGTGNLVPINYIHGLETAVMTDEVIIYGEDEEDTEAFRQRYFDTINADAQDGNVAQYKMWANEFAGIGNAKVFSLWNGTNTVKVSILDAENGVASATLIEDFQEYLDPNSEGLGNGIAPIGAVVTVSTASTQTINIAGSIVLAEGYSEIVGLENDLTEYFKEISYTKNTLGYISLGSVILNNASVERISSLTINGSTNDILLAGEEIPVLGTTEWTVIPYAVR